MTTSNSFPSATVPIPSSWSQQQFAATEIYNTDLLTALGAKGNISNSLTALTAFESNQGLQLGPQNNNQTSYAYENNPLGLTQPSQALGFGPSTSVNSVGVQAYPTVGASIAAAVYQLGQSNTIGYPIGQLLASNASLSAYGKNSIPADLNAEVWVNPASGYSSSSSGTFTPQTSGMTPVTIQQNQGFPGVSGLSTVLFGSPGGTPGGLLSGNNQWQSIALFIGLILVGLVVFLIGGFALLGGNKTLKISP